jgi:hypothetical protein
MAAAARANSRKTKLYQTVTVVKGAALRASEDKHDGMMVMCRR